MVPTWERSALGLDIVSLLISFTCRGQRVQCHTAEGWLTVKGCICSRSFGLEAGLALGWAHSLSFGLEAGLALGWAHSQLWVGGWARFGLGSLSQLWVGGWVHFGLGSLSQLWVGGSSQGNRQ